MDDVSSVGPPGMVPGTKLCDMCCSACEASGDLCSPPAPPPAINPYSPPTPHPTPAPSAAPTPVPSEAPTPQPTAFPLASPSPGRMLQEIDFPSPPWMPVATHSREMVKAKSCYHLCFRDSISDSSCSVTGVEEPVQEGSLVDIACQGPRQSVVPMQFSCFFVASSRRFSCTSVGGEPEPLIF